MKLKLITLAAIGAFSLGSTAFAQEPQGGQGERGGRGGGGRGARGASIERITDQLNLTPDQKAKAQPIIDQARPQIENIRREAMQKMKAVMDNAVAQIRPLLTPEQQKKLDEVKNERKMGREGHGGHHGRQGQGQDGQDDDSDVGDQ
jgi:Spy/CpxP family protein refolding chaperone